MRSPERASRRLSSRTEEDREQDNDFSPTKGSPERQRSPDGRRGGRGVGGGGGAGGGMASGAEAVLNATKLMRAIQASQQARDARRANGYGVVAFPPTATVVAASVPLPTAEAAAEAASSSPTRESARASALASVRASAAAAAAAAATAATLASPPLPPQYTEADVDTVWAGELLVKLYPYNDVQIKATPPDGHSFHPSAFAAERLFLQLDGQPADVRALLTPKHRLWQHASFGAWAAFHMGEQLSESLFGRPKLSTEALYGSQGEARRSLRIVRLRAAATTLAGAAAAASAEQPAAVGVEATLVKDMLGGWGATLRSKQAATAAADRQVLEDEHVHV